MSLRIIRNDLLKMKVDAIVNPTDCFLSGLGSIDLKIHQAGQKELKNELSKFGRCDVGDAILTRAYNLPCKYIIHTVGPIWNKNKNVFKSIESCYKNCLNLAVSYNIESVAFPLIATGSFGCPVGKTIQVAINTINSFLIDFELDVYLVVYSSEAFGISKKLVDDVKSYIDTDIMEEDRIKKIRQLFSFYEFNNKPISRDLIGQTRVSEVVKSEPVLERNFCINEKDFQDLLPKLDKIKFTNEDSFTYKLFKIIDDNKLKDSDVYNAAGISKMVFSNLRKGVIPKKKTVFQLCLALPINLDQAIDLLASAGYTFILSDKFEKIIKILIDSKNPKILTRIDVVDLLLYDLGLPVFNNS